MQDTSIFRDETITSVSLIEAQDPILAARATVLQHLSTSCPLPAELVRPARFPAIALMVARSGPWLPAADLALLADVILFVFATDDLADEGDLPIDELTLRLDQYADCLAGRERPEVAFDPIARCALSIAARLRSSPLGDRLWSAWAARSREFLMSMITEQQLSAALASGEHIGLEEYLDAGASTVAIAFVSTAAWMLIGEEPMAAMSPAIRAAERHLSRAARLANDLRSQDREREEGSANAVFVVGAGGEQALRRMLTDELVLGRERLAEWPRGTFLSASFLDGFVDFVISLYAAYDFHTFPAISAHAQHEPGIG